MYVDLGKNGRISFTWKQVLTLVAGILAWGRVEIGFAVDRAECARLKEQINAIKKADTEQKERFFSVWAEQNKQWQENWNAYQEKQRQKGQ